MPPQASWDSTFHLTRTLVSSAWMLMTVMFPGSKGTRKISNKSHQAHRWCHDLPPPLEQIWRTCDPCPVPSSKRGVTVISYGVLTSRSVREEDTISFMPKRWEGIPSCPSVSSVPPTSQCHICVSAVFPVISTPIVGVVDHISTDGLIWSLPCDQDDALVTSGLNVADPREACGVRNRAQHRTVVRFRPYSAIYGQRVAGNTHSLQQLERKQSHRQTASHPGRFWGWFCVHLASQHTQNPRRKRPWSHRGDSAWGWRSMRLGTLRGSPAKRSKRTKRSQDSGVVWKPSSQHVSNEVLTFHMVSTFLTPFSFEPITFLHRCGLKSTSEEEWDVWNCTSGLSRSTVYLCYLKFFHSLTV